MVNSLEESLKAAVNSGEASSTGTGRRKGRSMQYWRTWMNDTSHSRHNWISVGPAFSPVTAIEFMEFMERKQAEPLDKDKYGQYDGSAGKTEIFNNGTRFNPLIRGKGIHEMPKSQILALGWHRNPQLAAMCPEEYELDQVVDVLCPVDGRPFLTDRDMRRYTRAMYPEATSAGAIGSEVGKALANAGSVGGTTLTAEQLIAIMAESSKENAAAIAGAIATAFAGMNKTPAEVATEAKSKDK